MKLGCSCREFRMLGLVETECLNRCKKGVEYLNRTVEWEYWNRNVGGVG